jgi:hypothetical protein
VRVTSATPIESGNLSGGSTYTSATVCKSDSSDGVTTDQMGVGCRLTNLGLGLYVESIDNGTAVLHLDPVPCGFCDLMGKRQ